MKKLSEMTLKELWELFPIILTEPNPCWQGWFCEEKDRLDTILPKNNQTAINHIGSTSVGTIMAKPIIDILVEIPKNGDMQAIKELLTKNGYICMSEENNRISFNKGYTENGFAEKVYHLHLRYYGDNDELYFKNYLISHPDVASEYEKLKLSLWKKYEHDRDGYTNAKAEFVLKYTKEAKKEL